LPTDAELNKVMAFVKKAWFGGHDRDPAEGYAEAKSAMTTIGHVLSIVPTDGGVAERSADPRGSS
jgi:hypothetical protein